MKGSINEVLEKIIVDAVIVSVRCFSCFLGLPPPVLPGPVGLTGVWGAELGAWVELGTELVALELGALDGRGGIADVSDTIT